MSVPTTPVTSLTYFFPAYNEAGNITPLVRRALEVMPGYAVRLEVIIVDDGSSDGTQAEAESLAASIPEVRYLRHERNLGYGEALRTGLAAATGDYVFYTDGDRQFDLAELERLWQKLGDADVVAGYRVRRADPVHRLFIARTYNTILRVLFGLRMRDVDCAFKLIKAEVSRSVRPNSGGAFFSAEFLLRARRAGFRVVEVGVNHYPRTVGRPKGATPAVILRTFREMFQLWWGFRRGRG
jgi:glycosyltransferase involved in cell wall biosynthesis